MLLTNVKRNVHRFITEWTEKRAVESARRKCLGNGEVSDLKKEEWSRSLKDVTDFYTQCYRYFHKRLPEPLREHRTYFCQEKRGFGEDAFHTMWFLLVREFRPANFLEIGVYRGQTLSLLSMLQKMNGIQPDVTGISPFSPTNDSGYRYLKTVDYMEDTIRNFKHFGLPEPKLCRAYSTDANARELIASRKWAMIYIDGNHEYDVVQADWQLCSANVIPGGVIVLDDSGLNTAFNPPPFASKGQDGPSRIAQEINRREFAEILQVGHNRVFQKQ